ncbi:hypothetical protein ORV05_34190 [Amycolatopsis cynarae]|uniref:Uncharacterized protein n=1 Tax=Amycolatopsis cynarae TaxID=2995223 RepID=A0ABY7B4N0_9PSEU|nr:hypothetical protein [Amycolatopsis sp. HUAS 11-8]WAL65851.1 hypothetical protein ORV05_34190 [Amycolatopsis sp. HUAS 11-8]
MDNHSTTRFEQEQVELLPSREALSTVDAGLTASVALGITLGASLSLPTIGL